MVAYKAKSLPLFAIGVLLLFNTSFAQKSKYKLLLYATIEDSVVLHKSDTSWLKKDICIQLNIDTINIANIKNNSNKYCKNCFLYNENIFYYSQLFDLNYYPDLIRMKIAYFTISTAIAIDPPYITAPLNCLNEEQKILLKRLWEISRKYGRYKNTNRLFIDNITVYYDYYRPITLNPIYCYFR